MFSIVSPSVTQLTEAVKSAENWVSTVESMLVNDLAVLPVFSSYCYCYKIYREHKFKQAQIRRGFNMYMCSLVR